MLIPEAFSDADVLASYMDNPHPGRFEDSTKRAARRLVHRFYPAVLLKENGERVKYDQNLPFEKLAGFQVRPFLTLFR